MPFAFINDNKVVKILDVLESEAMSEAHLFQQVFDVSIFSREPKVGWIHESGKVFPDIKPVTPRQIRQALILTGHSLSDVDNAIAALPEPHRSLASAEWEYSTLVFRRNQLVEMLGASQGWTAQDLDDLWIFAGGL